MPWIAGGTLVLGLAAALQWQRYETSRPTYALAQIELAARQHDATKLAYYADKGALTSEVVGETIDWLTQHRRLNDVIEGEGELGTQGRAVRIQNARVTFEDRANRAVSATLAVPSDETGTLPQRLVDAFATVAPMSAVIAGDRLDLRTVGPARVMGQTAQIPLTLRDRDLIVDIHLNLELEREGSRWRVVGLTGLGPALGVIDRAQVERLDIANGLRAQHMAGLLAVGAPNVGRITHRRSRPAYRLSVPLTNRTRHTVEAVSLGLRTENVDESRAVALEVQHAIPAGTQSSEVWQFSDASAGTRVSSLLTHPERLLVGIRSVVMDSAGNADTLRLFRNYSEFRKSGGSLR